MKRAGISLALVVMLLLGAAAPVQAQAEETGLAAEAESFYRSVLAAKDRETLQTYLDCFSDQRRVELRAELPATLRQGLDTVLQQMKLPSITPVEENTQQKRDRLAAGCQHNLGRYRGQLHPALGNQQRSGRGRRGDPLYPGIGAGCRQCAAAILGGGQDPAGVEPDDAELPQSGCGAG